MSYSQYLKGRAIMTGCEWRLSIKINSSVQELFQTTAKFLAHVRNSADGPILTTLSSQTSTITRISGNSLELIIPAAASENWLSGAVIMDVIRTDLLTPIHLGFDLTVPVKRSVTRV